MGLRRQAQEQAGGSDGRGMECESCDLYICASVVVYLGRMIAVPGASGDLEIGR